MWNRALALFVAVPNVEQGFSPVFVLVAECGTGLPPNAFESGAGLKTGATVELRPFRLNKLRAGAKPPVKSRHQHGRSVSRTLPDRRTDRRRRHGSRLQGRGPAPRARRGAQVPLSGARLVADRRRALPP